MTPSKYIFCILLSTICLSLSAENSRKIPERTLPVPDTVSPEVQEVMKAPTGDRERFMKHAPKSMREWRYIIKEHQKITLAKVAWLKEHFPVQEIENLTVAGVNAYLVTPKGVTEENQDCLLINVHGGAFIFSDGEATLPEALLMAHYIKVPMLVIDYRLAPDHPFPAGLDDVVTVYKEVLKSYPPENIGMFGVSSGGNFIAAAMLKLKAMNVPLPAVLSLGAPVCDLRKEGGDSHYTNEYVDSYLVTCDGMIKAAVELYAQDADWNDPLLSPINGDFSQFPPCILTSGTRDLLLSDTVRMYAKLREAGIEAKLQIFEGLSHSQYLSIPYAPESKLALSEIALFLNTHLSNRN